ncbi:MAG: cytochrome c oxidase subunit II, partial [Mesorhizobium sp.]
AGTLTMSRGNLAAWIADPQGIKPGAHMPVVGLNGDELNAIVAYLEGLK